MPAARHLLPFVLLAVGACAATAPAPLPRVIPPPPPMPAAEIPPGGQPANLTTAHGGACTIAVFDEVPSRIEGVRRVQADDASFTEFPAEGARVVMSGTGRYYVDGAAWTPFAFRCVYDEARAAIVAFDIERR